MQKSSSFNSPSAKSVACHTHDFSFPACSCTVIVAITAKNTQDLCIRFKKNLALTLTLTLTTTPNNQINKTQSNGPRWLAQILRVLDCLITRRTLLESLCLRNFTVPAPLSFHWFPSLSNRYSFAFLQIQIKFKKNPRFKRSAKKPNPRGNTINIYIQSKRTAREWFLRSPRQWRRRPPLA
jgi:hypothetical protein